MRQRRPSSRNNSGNEERPTGGPHRSMGHSIEVGGSILVTGALEPGIGEQGDAEDEGGGEEQRD